MALATVQPHRKHTNLVTTDVDRRSGQNKRLRSYQQLGKHCLAQMTIRLVDDDRDWYFALNWLLTMRGT